MRPPDRIFHYGPPENSDAFEPLIRPICERINQSGWLWDTDSRASNCTMKDDRRHRCWVKHGEPPALHVDKNGHTCQAGAGSILSRQGWHGFLRNGELVT